jgi:L-amino acid N-acyltransferase YncA
MVDVPLVHRLIQKAIRSSPLYCEQMKEHESSRYTRGYLRALVAADPHYVFLVLASDDKVAGFIVSGPEYGNVVVYWVYLEPDYRVGALAMRAMRDFVDYWDNGRFHKITAFVRPENRSPLLIMKRNGYRQVAFLEKHLFGEDYFLFERPLTKVEPGYQGPIAVGLRGRVMLKLRAMMEGG